MRTQAETWHPIYCVLPPGEIVRGAGSRDADVTADTQFHKRDERLLCFSGVTKVPHDGCDLSTEPSFQEFLSICRK